MTQEPGKWMDRMIGWCFGILLGVIALYCAVALIKPILPTLILIVGVLAIAGLLIGAVVVFRAWRDRW
ncbi:hypothetical protein QN239_07190 [Mycolicibacterium sp. Y3]